METTDSENEHQKETASTEEDEQVEEKPQKALSAAKKSHKKQINF